jgi:hypothetical protein
VKKITINEKPVAATHFAYDGCHKIYLLEDEADKAAAKRAKYDLLPIKSLPKTYMVSCACRFISNWKLNTHFAAQFEEVCFGGAK